jgi:type I restriction enzyme S subunit
LKDKRIDSAYLSYHFHSEEFKQRVRDVAVGQTMASLNTQILKSIKTILPPTLAEQQAIAEALSDADALIKALEQLIAKKRQIKQGTMQELLSGKRRLPGFSGEWKLIPLGEVANILSGGTPSTLREEYWNGDIYWCTPTDVTALRGNKYLETTGRMITSLGLQNSSAGLIPAKSVIMTSRATIGECAINRVPVTTNQGFKNFVPLENIDVEFLYYLLGTKKNDFISLCGGSTFLEIGKTQLSNFEVRLPVTKAEQVAISTILSDMDTEIAALEEKLAKARLLKQGMMQELLNGRIRLI